MTEIEAKFLIHEESQIARLLETIRANGVQIEEATTLDILDIYFDTPDWRLYRAGWAYRWQNASGRLRLGLKTLNRNESAVQVREETEQLVAELPPSPGNYPAGPVGDLLQSLLGNRIPKELFRVQKDRKRYLLKTARGACMELAIDDAAITAAVTPESGKSGFMRFRELEIELQEGDPASLHDLVETIKSSLGPLAARLSKFERGLQTAGLRPPRKPLIPSLAAVNPTDPVVRVAYHSLAHQFQALREEEDGTWEGLEPEGLHRMRVATRRLREAFRVFRDVLPERPRLSFRREFRWLARALGAVRDLDVYQQNFDRYAALIPPEDSVHLQVYRSALARQWEKARRRLEAILASRRYGRLTGGFTRFLERGPSQRAVRESRALPSFMAGPKIINRRSRQVLRRGRAIQKNSTPQTLHQLRIRCKRLRYACEFFQAIYGERLTDYLTRLKLIQDILGEHQDACVASERLRTYAARVPFRKKYRGLLVALGQLVSSQQHLAAAKREILERAWKRFDKKKLRRGVKESFKELGYHKPSAELPPTVRHAGEQKNPSAS